MTIPNLPPINNDALTPDGKVIKNADTRRTLGNILWTISILAAIASLGFQFFPELVANTDIPLRAVSFTNAVVSLLTGAFGIAVVRVNTGNPTS